jgi:hypothetical protein
MHRWRIGPSLALILLIAIAVWVVVSFSPPTFPQISKATNQHNKPKSAENEHSSLFFVVGVWIHDNREIIDPLAAVGAFIAASVLAIVTFMLFGATEKLAATTGDLANAAHEQVVEMALARELLARRLDLQEKQFLLADRQYTLAERQLGFQREQYLAEHRPRIKIRSVAISRAPAGGIIEPGRVIEGSLVIVNIGAADAHIRRADYCFFWSRNGLPIAPPLVPERVKPLFGSIDLPYPLPGHASCLIPVKSGGPVGGVTGDRSGGHLYIMGDVLFSDGNLNERWTGFCQEYTPAKTAGGEGRFIPVDDPNYEYED